jgi:hypothetical protein
MREVGLNLKKIYCKHTWKGQKKTLVQVIYTDKNVLLCFKKVKKSQVPVAHSYNIKYLGG